MKLDFNKRLKTVHANTKSGWLDASQRLSDRLSEQIAAAPAGLKDSLSKADAVLEVSPSAPPDLAVLATQLTKLDTPASVVGLQQILNQYGVPIDRHGITNVDLTLAPLSALKALNAFARQH
jgi:hypothetical protein